MEHPDTRGAARAVARHGPRLGDLAFEGDLTGVTRVRELEHAADPSELVPDPRCRTEAAARRLDMRAEHGDGTGARTRACAHSDGASPSSGAIATTFRAGR
jgi:hypothetical protein